MDVALQAKLLRFVPNGSFTKVGGSQRTHQISASFPRPPDPLKEVKPGGSARSVLPALRHAAGAAAGCANGGMTCC